MFGLLVFSPTSFCDKVKQKSTGYNSSSIVHAYPIATPYRKVNQIMYTLKILLFKCFCQEFCPKDPVENVVLKRAVCYIKKLLVNNDTCGH